MEIVCGFWQLMLFGRVMTDGRLSARLKCDLTENLTLKGNAQVGILCPSTFCAVTPALRRYVIDSLLLVCSSQMNHICLTACSTLTIR